MIKGAHSAFNVKLKSNRNGKKLKLIEVIKNIRIGGGRMWN
jgi:hypothetical protein